VPKAYVEGGLADALDHGWEQERLSHSESTMLLVLV
jgi:hypothetical protein